MNLINFEIYMIRECTQKYLQFLIIITLIKKRLSMQLILELSIDVIQSHEYEVFEIIFYASEWFNINRLVYCRIYLWLLLH